MANATLLGVGGDVASLQAINTALAAVAASTWGNNRIAKDLTGDGVTNVYTGTDSAHEKSR
ncbi:MAG: hypothetical protein ACJ79I_13430 [Gemmatimonadaceae bacterium]